MWYNIIRKREGRYERMKWVIVYIAYNGIKTVGGIVFDNYEGACMMQEVLDFQNPNTAHLVYTVDEWEREKAEYGWW